jgi:putative intracellular protease/amidase
VLAHHRGAEVTDFVVPFGILAASGVAEVIAVGTQAGPVPMFPALTLEVDWSTATFDEHYPDGADYVIVPAVHHPGAPELTTWLQRQHARGATIVGVCDGVLVLARAGLLDRKRATAHWYAINGLERRHPETDWLRNTRYVADGAVITTSGVSASVPVSIALVQAMGGREVAEDVARGLGIREWSPVHSSAGFRLRRHLGTAAGNWVAFWRKERVAIRVQDGVDEVALALVADLWSRTYRSSALTISADSGVVVTRGGLRLRVDRPVEGSNAHRTVTLPDRSNIGLAIPETLDRIAAAHGRSTAAWVASQIEYPWP